jgi:hypothetical protein
MDSESVICPLLSKLRKCYNEGYAAYNRLSGIWRLWSVHSCPHWRKMDTLFTGYGYQRYIACNLSTLFNIGEMLQWRTSRLPGNIIRYTESVICPLLAEIAKCSWRDTPFTWLGYPGYGVCDLSTPVRRRCRQHKSNKEIESLETLGTSWILKTSLSTKIIFYFIRTQLYNHWHIIQCKYSIYDDTLLWSKEDLWTFSLHLMKKFIQ